MWILIETDFDNNDANCCWGPFKDFSEAADFGNRRIALLANEWDGEEDGFLINCLKWEIRRLNTP
jgi:hypothetical protein